MFLQLFGVKILNNQTVEEIYAVRFNPNRIAVSIYGITVARSFA